MASILDYFQKGIQIFWCSFKTRCYFKGYGGNADNICQEIVKKCWNGRFFQTSVTNFQEFWSRDFGWCTQSLMNLEYKDEVHKTLRYALNKFKEHGKITTTISPKGKPFDVFVPAADSLPWLIHSIKVSKFPYHSYKAFLNKEISKYYDMFIDKQTGLVKPGLEVSSIKDFAIRKSSCYDNCMVGLLSKDLAQLKLLNPLKKFNYPTLIKQHFWNGKYFYDDLKQKDYVAGDANVFPFIFGLFNDKAMLKSAIARMQADELDLPIPLKYTKSREDVKFGWQEFFFKNYESNSVWTHMGPLFVKLVKEIDVEQADGYKEKYKELIERCKGYPEVLFPNGKPYRSFIYHSDMNMLWAANYLTM